MLHSNYGKLILDGLLSQGSGGNIYFSHTGCYLGLLTDLDTFSEPNDTVYRRVDLTKESRLTKGPFLTEAKTDSADNKVEIDGYEVVPAYITNLSPIQFDEATKDWTIVGFAIFPDNSLNSTPFLYGEVIGEDGGNEIVIKSGNVPIIRRGSLKISLA